MAKTIIQTIGPLYGEPVNGTVFGRPNGSIYVPPNNTIRIDILDTAKYLVVSNVAGVDRLYISNSAGALRACTLVAEAQDLQSNIQTYIMDSDGVQVGQERNAPAGSFNQQFSFVGTGSELSLIQGAKYTLVAVLMNSGIPVATATVELTGVVVE